MTARPEAAAKTLADAAAQTLSWLEGRRVPPEDVQRDLAVSMARVRNAPEGGMTNRQQGARAHWERQRREAGQ